ncbi:MAG: hypothetical protein ACREJ3_13025 [Polyangiaceae bacterium]
MTSRLAPVALAAALSLAAGFALLHTDHGAGAAPPLAVAPVPPPSPLPTEDDPSTQGADLPPGHPAIGGGMSPHGSMPQAVDEPATIAWTVPAAWQVVPNPNAMRIATYRVPPVARGAEAAEVSVARAGGSTEANIQRWIGEFQVSGPAKREDKTVRGVKVSTVDVEGRYLGGAMMPGQSAPARPGWAFMGAIVDGVGSPYFFKMVGPAATVHAAAASFAALIASIAPV